MHATPKEWSCGDYVDVFVLESHRGHQLGSWLVEAAVSQPEMARVRRWILGTRDAHELYRQFGFTEPQGTRLMERFNPDSER